MKIYKSPYTLTPSTALNSKVHVNTTSGWLLKFDNEDGLVGYSSIQTWPQFGDPTLEELEARLQRLNSFSDKSDSQIVNNVLNWAHQDAIARSENRSAFSENFYNVKNNYLLTKITDLTDDYVESIKAMGFDTLKIKMGNNIEEDTNFLLNHKKIKDFKLRIDFNTRLTYEQARLWLTETAELSESFDYIEDISIFNVNHWSQLRRGFNVPLALDFHLEENLKIDAATTAIDYIIVKPFCDNVKDVISWANQQSKKVVFTSYMDHTLSVVQAANTASEHIDSSLAVENNGMYTQHVYLEDNYSKRVELQETCLRLPKDIGFGFTDLLQSENWQRIGK